MKKIMLLCALFTGFLVSAQNSMGKQDCSGVTSGKTSQDVPFYEAKSEGVIFRKQFDADKVYNILRLNATSHQEGSKGVSVQLSNNVKIERPNAKLTSIDNGKGGVISFTSVILKPEEIELLKNNEIVKTTIAGVESTIKTGGLLKNYFNCILSKEPLVIPAKKIATGDCSEVSIQKITPEGWTHYITPDVDGVSIRKMTNGSKNRYIATVMTGSVAAQTGIGVRIAFKNGDFISYSDIKNISKMGDKEGEYEYTAIFEVMPEHIDYFKNSGIRGIQVGEAMHIITQAEIIQKLAACLINK